MNGHRAAVRSAVRGTINKRQDPSAARSTSGTINTRQGASEVWFQVILSTEHDHVHELDLDAPDACTAAWLAGGSLRDEDPETIVTNVHARRVHNGEH